MKPITHPLAIAKLCAERAYNIEAHMPGDEGPRIACDAADDNWHAAGSPLYADPTPMPAPALGMRVWREVIGKKARMTTPRDLDIIDHGATWETLSVDVSKITLITDYRKGDVVLWERQ